VEKLNRLWFASQFPLSLLSISSHSDYNFSLSFLSSSHSDYSYLLSPHLCSRYHFIFLEIFLTHPLLYYREFSYFSLALSISLPLFLYLCLSVALFSYSLLNSLLLSRSVSVSLYSSSISFSISGSIPLSTSFSISFSTSSLYFSLALFNFPPLFSPPLNGNLGVRRFLTARS
jgi:hypothetical protein